MDVEIKELPAQRIAAVRHVGPFKGLAPAFERICGWAGQHQLFGPDTRVLGLFHDDPSCTPEAELRSDAAVTVGDSVESDGEDIRIDEIPAGTYAVAIHRGSYDKLAESYGWLAGTWIPESGRSMAPAPSFEVYLNDATSTPEDELLTAIHLPLEAS